MNSCSCWLVSVLETKTASVNEQLWLLVYLLVVSVLETKTTSVTEQLWLLVYLLVVSVIEMKIVPGDLNSRPDSSVRHYQLYHGLSGINASIYTEVNNHVTPFNVLQF